MKIMQNQAISTPLPVIVLSSQQLTRNVLTLERPTSPTNYV